MKNKLSDWINHSVKRELYGNAAREKAVALLTTLYSQLLETVKKTRFIPTKKKYLELLSEIKRLLAEYKSDYNTLLSSEINNIADIESEYVSSFMKELGKDIIIPATILTSLKFSPVASQTNYKMLIESSVDRIERNAEVVLRNSMMTGNQIDTEAIERNIKTETNNVTGDVETFNTTAFTVTDYLIFKKNKEKIVYSAILDNKTCLVCGSYDGKEFELKDAPIPPLHQNCRCILIPVSAVDNELPTFTEWLEEQTEDSKYQILGKGRYELYKQGLSIDRFINNGNIIPLKELKI